MSYLLTLCMDLNSKGTDWVYTWKKKSKSVKWFKKLNIKYQLRFKQKYIQDKNIDHSEFLKMSPGIFILWTIIAKYYSDFLSEDMEWYV